MVSFIADPRIKRADKQRQLMLARALQPYKLPKNPYGGSPIAGNLQRLAEGWAAGQAGKRATSLEKAQKDAQAKIMAQILQLQQLPAGSTLDIQEAEEIQGIRDDGRIIPASVSRKKFQPRSLNISPELAKTAGIDRNVLASKESALNKAASAAYTAEQNAAIDANIVEAYQAGDEERVAALRLLRDPMKATKPGTEKGPRFYPSATGGPGAGTIVSPNGDIQAINPTIDEDTGDVTGYSISPIVEKQPKPTDGSIAAADGAPGVEKPAVPVPGPAKRAGQKAIAVATGKALVKAKEQYPKLLSSRATMLADADAVTEMVDDAIAMLKADPKATGRWGTVALIDPESPASVLKVKLDQISAYAAFSALQQMREASVTGGALGQVSERELALLIASKFAGKHGLPAEDLIRALNTFRQRVKRAVEISEELTQNMAARIGGTIEGEKAVATGTTEVDKYLRQYLEK
tara:strand:+ start:532 stop:1923 length:1392 start_codon:yes stop_codon:yes gene_type:complete